MMRALWSAASGMRAQQTNLDSISHNLANVNTNGYKTEKPEFKTLLYQTLQTRTTTANGEEKPISAQVGLGTRVASITSSFEQGPIFNVDSKSALAIEGNGLFAVSGNEYVDMNQSIGLWQFNNDAGLEKITGTYYRETDASGAPMNEAANPGLRQSKIAQSHLEGSNVQVADEMVNMIIAQRAYELNSRAITTSDTMLEQANNLKR